MCVRAGVSVVLQFGVKRAFCAPHTVDAQQAEQQQNAEPHEHGAEDGGPEAAGGSVEEQEETTAPSEATRSTSLDEQEEADDPTVLEAEVELPIGMTETHFSGMFDYRFAIETADGAVIEEGSLDKSAKEMFAHFYHNCRTNYREPWAEMDLY